MASEPVLKEFFITLFCGFTPHERKADIFEEFENNDVEMKKMEKMLHLQHELTGESTGESMFNMYLAEERLFYEIVKDSDRKDALIEYISKIVQQNLCDDLKSCQTLDIDEVVTETATVILAQESQPDRLLLPSQQSRISVKHEDFRRSVC